MTRVAPVRPSWSSGLGPAGAMAARPACARGAVRVLGTGLVAERPALAATLGVESVEGDGARSAIREMTGGRGPEAVVEAVGSDATIELINHCPSPPATDGEDSAVRGTRLSRAVVRC